MSTSSAAGQTGEGGHAPGSGGAGGAASAASGSGGNGAGAGSGGRPSTATSLPAAPPGCESVNHHVDGAMCTLSFECQAAALFSRCDADADGSWSCQCTPAKGGAPIQELVLLGAHADTACGAMARACFTHPPATEESCRRVSEVFGADECAIEETCGPTQELDSGIRAEGGARVSVSCRASDAGLSCSCQPPIIGKRELLVTAPSIELGCEHALEACKSGLPASAAPLNCTDEASDPGELGNIATACGFTRSCTQLATDGDGSSIRSALDRQAVCYVGAVGSRDLVCHCEDGNLASMSFTANAGLDGACETALDACTGAIELTPSGLPDCSLSYREAQGQQCEASLRCTRALQLGDMKILAEGEAKLLCLQATAGGHWWCSCDSHGAPTIFELGPAPSAEEACVAGLERCSEEIDIGFGLHPRAPAPPSPI